MLQLQPLSLPRSRHGLQRVWRIHILLKFPLMMLSSLQIIFSAAPFVVGAVDADATVTAVLNTLFSSLQSSPVPRNRSTTSSLRWLQEDTSNGNGNDGNYSDDEYYYYYNDDYAAIISACEDELDAVSVCMNATVPSFPESSSSSSSLTPEQVALNEVALACNECVVDASTDAYNQFQQDLNDPAVLLDNNNYAALVQCSYLQPLVCLPIRNCACLAPCATEFSHMFDCQFQVSWQTQVDKLATAADNATTSMVLPDACAELVCDNDETTPSNDVTTDGGDSNGDNNGADSSSNSNSGSTTTTDNSGSESSGAATAARNAIMVIARLLFFSGTAAFFGL